MVETFDRVYDHDKQVMTDEWKKVDYRFVAAGELLNTYCTDSRRVLISEVPIEEKVDG